jgi:hypothetical protein
MTTTASHILGIAFSFQLALAPACWSKEPKHRSHLLTQRIETILAGLEDTKYQAKTVVDHEKGT